MSFDKYFTDTEEINVIFLGGSITEGAGSSQREHCYAQRVSRWLEQNISDSKTVKCFNKGVGGTDSQYGLLRLSRDVISLNPHLVFVEFAVNDAGTDSRKYMESIVRSLMAASNPYIVFLYTTNSEYTTVTSYHEQVAEYYGISQISLKDALEKELGGKNAKDMGYLVDSVHPTDKGYDVYYRKIISCLETGEYFKKPDCTLQPLTDSFLVKTQFVSSAGDGVKRCGDWQISTSSPNRPWARSSQVGDSISLRFEGNILAIEHGLHADSNMYEIIIDGKKEDTIHPVSGDIRTNQLVVGYINFDLPDGEHDVEIRTVEYTKDGTEGTQVLIYNFITGNIL